MKRLLLILALALSANAWAEKIYFDCGKPLNESRTERSNTDFGLLLLLDMQEKTHLTTKNPLAKLQEDAEWRLHFDSLLEKIPMRQTAFELDIKSSYLKLLEHAIYFGVENSDGSGFIKTASIDRVNLIYVEDLPGTKHQCKFINESEYDSTIKNWKMKLDKDQQEFEARRKF